MAGEPCAGMLGREMVFLVLDAVAFTAAVGGALRLVAAVRDAR